MAVPSANSTARCSLQIIKRAEAEERAELRTLPSERERTSDRAGGGERRTGVKREPQLLGHVFFLGTEIGEGERRQGLGLKTLLASGANAAPPLSSSATRPVVAAAKRTVIFFTGNSP